MKKATILAALLVSSSIIFGQSWSLDKAHSYLGFRYTHLGIAELDGSFKITDARFTSSKTDFTDAVIELTGDVNSINTGNEQRDGHLKSPDFFDAAKYPTFTFKSTSFKKAGDKKYKLTGDFTMHGVTKSVTLDVVFNGTTTHPMSKKTIVGFKITGIIKRSDFGIASSMPSAMLGDEVGLQAGTEFVKE